MKLILGTAQLGMNYGISNVTGLPSSEETDEVFRLCRENKIQYCDTALSYGRSHENVKSRGLRIITKISLGENYISDLENIFNEFDENELDTILVHNPQVLVNNSFYWNELLDAQKKRQFKLGVSVYTVEQTRKLLERKIVPQTIQIPYNIFDRKFDEILPELNALGIEIHARSLFLQGIFFLNINRIPEKLNVLLPPLKSFDIFCNKNHHEKIKNALHFVLHNNWIDKLVVGIEKPQQLMELIKIYNLYEGNIIPFSFEFTESQKMMLNPSNW